MYLSSIKDLMPAIIMMDRIKYRRMLPVYLADMIYPKESSPDIWDHFQEGNFAVQKDQIPFTAIGRDHAGEQENKKFKILGGIKGITKNINARTRYFLISLVLQQIVDEVKTMGGVEKKKPKLHHHLNKAHSDIQARRVKSLVTPLEDFGLFMSAREDNRLYNIVTGKVFPEEICDKLFSINDDGGKHLKVYV